MTSNIQQPHIFKAGRYMRQWPEEPAKPPLSDPATQPASWTVKKFCAENDSRNSRKDQLTQNDLLEVLTLYLL